MEAIALENKIEDMKEEKQRLLNDILEAEYVLHTAPMSPAAADCRGFVASLEDRPIHAPCMPPCMREEEGALPSNR